MDPVAGIVGRVFYPLWDIKDGSHRLREWRRLEQSQWMSRDELLSRQWEAARHLVDEARTHSAFYRDRLERALVPSGQELTREAWSKIPILTKREIRENGDAMRSDRFRPEELAVAKTGGSTGVALRVLFDRR